jgi:hypothetical protein
MTWDSPYSGADDLLLGDITLGSSVSKVNYVKAAGDEIDSRLGYVYELPFPDDIAEHAKKLLKKINNNLASGRLIMAVAAGGEDSKLHAYGASLVQDAYNELALILNGTLPIDGATRTGASDAQAGPTISNQDEFSATGAFEYEFFENPTQRGPLSGPGWTPGPYTGRDY